MLSLTRVWCYHVSAVLESLVTYEVFNFQILKGALYSCVSQYRRGSCTTALSLPALLSGSTILVPTIELSKFNRRICSREHGTHGVYLCNLLVGIIKTHFVICWFPLSWRVFQTAQIQNNWIFLFRHFIPPSNTSARIWILCSKLEQGFTGERGIGIHSPMDTLSYSDL